MRPETADSILLYAGNHPVFVVDAYTRRILERHQIVTAESGYDEIRQLCEHSLRDESIASDAESSEKKISASPPASCHKPSRLSTVKRSALAQVFNEMHGLIVGVGKTYCLKSQPRCEQCPLQKFLPHAK